MGSKPHKSIPLDSGKKSLALCLNPCFLNPCPYLVLPAQFCQQYQHRMIWCRLRDPMLTCCCSLLVVHCSTELHNDPTRNSVQRCCKITPQQTQYTLTFNDLHKCKMTPQQTLYTPMYNSSHKFTMTLPNDPTRNSAHANVQ